MNDHHMELLAGLLVGFLLLLLLALALYTAHLAMEGL